MSPHLDQRQLYAAIDGEVGEAERLHLAGCPACRHALEQRSRLLEALRSASPPPPSALRTRTLADRFADALVHEGQRRARWAQRGPALAAAGGLAAACAAALVVVRLVTPETAGAPGEPVHPSRPLPVAVLEIPEVVVIPWVHEEPPLLPSETPQIAAPERAPASTTVAPRPVSRQRRERDRTATPPARFAAASDRVVGPQAPTGAVQLVDAADAIVEQLSQAVEPEEIQRGFAAYKRLVIGPAAKLAPEALIVRIERIAQLSLPPPQDEEAAYLACESALALQRYEGAYRLCSTYLERFPRGPRARDVAYLTATIARVHLDDCRAAVVRYGQALLFSGMLQSLNDEAYFGRAICRARLGQVESARADLDMYLHKRPGRAQASDVRALAKALGRHLPAPPGLR